MSQPSLRDVIGGPLVRSALDFTPLIVRGIPKITEQNQAVQ